MEEVVVADLATQIVNFIMGAGGLSAIVAMLMEVVKKSWKPEVKALYWVPAVGISAVSSYGLLWYMGTWNFFAFLICTALIAGGQLLTNNEAWPSIKTAVIAVLKKLVIKK